MPPIKDVHELMRNMVSLLVCFTSSIINRSPTLKEYIYDNQTGVYMNMSVTIRQAYMYRLLTSNLMSQLVNFAALYSAYSEFFSRYSENASL